MPIRAIASFLLCCFALASAAEDKPLKIALICAGSTSDGGWNQLAKDGLMALKKQLGAEVSVIEKVAQDKAGDEMRDYLADGTDLIIAHGYEFLNPAAEVAKNDTKAHIAVSGADAAKPGIVAIDFDVSQASYQIGMLAASLSKSGKLGFIGGAPIPSVKACYRGFVAGARSVNPKVSVVEAYTAWDQPEKSKAQAEAFIQQGIDAIYPDVDAASRGVFEAIRERNAKQDKNGPVWVFGCVGDQNANDLCAAYTPASAVIKLDHAFLRIAQSVKDGTFTRGALEREDLAKGTCVTVLNPTLIGGVLTTELQAAVEAAGTKLAAGEIVIPAQ